MRLLTKITMAVALIAVTFHPIYAKDKTPSYNFNRALEEAQQGIPHG